ncbi:uncharacterized protein [Henckelia pumila]|uniref:uncharacterized protein isoform X2 n=1 Tax=Henckelia pumila TaxID=405737 RepID=UPI003C6E1851
MAIKSALFLLAFVLLATRMASSLVEVDAIETEHHDDHHHNHSKAPAHAPTKAPAHAPKKAPTHSPKKAPTHPPVFPPPHFCVTKCEAHCKGLRPIERCVKTCTACCAKFKCVPDSDNIGSKHYCKNWDGVVIHGKQVKCPRRN